MRVVCACQGCKKRLNLVERTILCRCGKAYCRQHRLSELHECRARQNKASPTLPKCVPRKLAML